jgi:ribosomal protein L11 methyltransferase
MFDLVIANILAPVLIDLMQELASQLKPGGKLILAGFVAKEEPAIVERSIAAGLQVERVTSELGWKCIVMTK